MLSELLETVACPSCGSDSFKVVRQHCYPPNLTKQRVVQLFSASSSHKLFDAVVRCRGCSLVYLNPRFKEEFISQSYAEAVDPTFVAQNPWRIRTFAHSLAYLAERYSFRPEKNVRILDVGCAGGAFLKAATDAGFSAVGVEPSKWLADYARHTYGVDVRTGILADQQLGTGSFDVVSLWDVIEHLPEPAQVIDQIRALLKSGGILVVNFPDYDSLARRILGKNWPMFLSVHLVYFTPRTLRHFLERRGFEILEARPFWQTLSLDYALSRAAEYFGVFKVVRACARGIGASNLSIKYNIGQTLLVARKRDGRADTTR